MTVTETAAPVLAESSLRSVLSHRARPPRPTPLVASVAFGWRAMLKIKHVPMQLFDVTVFPIMFVLLFTYLFGGALAGSPKEYLQVLLPGILVMSGGSSCAGVSVRRLTPHPPGRYLARLAAGATGHRARSSVG